jgi:hypothetical protein
MILKSLAITVVLLFATQAASEQPVEVMILGTYHFANPGLDMHNAEIDDVLAPQRQKEVAAVVDALARFKPTRVAVEARADELPSRSLPKYAEYLAGKHSQNRNEIHQIGYRLASRMKHEQVFGIDADGEFPFEALQLYAAANGRAEELQHMVDEIGVRTQRFEERAKTASVGQLLREMNEPAHIREDHAWYMRTLSYGAGKAQPGAHLVASWTARNIQICARLVQLAKPGDRIVVVYGAGHSQLLRQCVQDMPGWKLVEPNEYLPGAAGSADNLSVTIAALDTAVFDSFNQCKSPDKLQKHAGFFAPDVEFYHDTGGVTWTRQEMIANTEKNACGNYSRELVPGSLRVFPIGDFGAIAQGVHRFCQFATGKCEGLADFVMVWRNQDGAWQITRALSYGHRPNGGP